MNIGTGNQRRTILLIDTDPHARATLRIALEAAGFSVGEAANDHEGERTTRRIKPDAILSEFLHGAGGDGRLLSERLHAEGSQIPCYLVSSAAEAVLGSVGLHELGITGAFLKPIDTATLVRALKSRLGVAPERPRA